MFIHVYQLMLTRGFRAFHKSIIPLDQGGAKLLAAKLNIQPLKLRGVILPLWRAQFFKVSSFNSMYPTFIVLIKSGEIYILL